MAKRQTDWCFTLYGVTIEQTIARMGPQAQFVIAGDETCPKTSRKHVQGFIQMSYPTTLAQLRKLHAGHYETRRGTSQEARDYCTKEGTYLEYGSLVQKDAPAAEFWQMVKNGATNSELATAWPERFSLKIRIIEAMRQALNIRQVEALEELPTVTAVFGPPGRGKSEFIRRMIGAAPYYSPVEAKNGSKEDSLWWDGYNGEDIIWLQDYKGQGGQRLFLNLCDKGPLRVQTKGGTIKIRPKRIYFCSMYHPRTWFKNCPEWAILRRITEAHTPTTEKDTFERADWTWRASPA